jgi:hypothetical protein
MTIDGFEFSTKGLPGERGANRFLAPAEGSRPPTR